MYSPRANLLSANKEGIVSLIGESLPQRRTDCIITICSPGYLAIHLLGLSTGTLLLPPSPSYFRRQQRAQLARQNSNADTDTDNDSESDDVNEKAFPKTKGRSVLQRQNDKTAIELCSYAVVWWVLMGLTRVMGVGEGVSRRMVCICVFDPCPYALSDYIWKGEYIIHPLGSGVQHDVFIWVPLPRPVLLPVTTLAVCVFCYLETQSASTRQ